MVLEVGCSQTLADLQAKAQRWLQETPVRVVMLINISTNRQKLEGEIWIKHRSDNPFQKVLVIFETLITFILFRWISVVSTPLEPCI